MGMLPFSCRKPKYAYYVINNISLDKFKDHGLTKVIAATDSLTNDSVFIKLNMSTNYIAQVLDLNFTNSCFATTKATNGYKGLKNKITDITFSSNKMFNGRPPNSSLIDLLKYSLYTQQEISTLKKDLNDYAYVDNTGATPYRILYLTQRPTDSLRHVFTFQLIYENGTSNSAQVALTWK